MSEISSGLVAVAWQHSQRGLGDSEWQEWKTISWKPQGPESERFRMRPLCVISDAEAIIAQKDAEILEQCRINGIGSERELHLLAQVAAKDAEIAESDHIRDRCAHLLAETAVALKGPEKALHRHGWQDLPEVAAKQSAALKLAREALKFDGYPCGTGCKCIACESLAAIDSLQKGE